MGFCSNFAPDFERFNTSKICKYLLYYFRSILLFINTLIASAYIELTLIMNYEGIDGWAVSECGVFLLDNKARKEAVASFLVWSHKGLNLGPPDYESGATNQLSYETAITTKFY